MLIKLNPLFPLNHTLGLPKLSKDPKWCGTYQVNHTLEICLYKCGTYQLIWIKN